MPTTSPDKNAELVEQIRDFRKLSPLDKLRLLEEMQRFLDIATPPGAKRVMEKLRRVR